ncbi:hypothetical protein ACJJTC_013875 [Scirpophaga incertulas]
MHITNCIPTPRGDARGGSTHSIDPVPSRHFVTEPLEHRERGGPLCTSEEVDATGDNILTAMEAATFRPIKSRREELPADLCTWLRKQSELRRLWSCYPRVMSKLNELTTQLSEA